METKAYWLGFRVGDQYALSPFHCETRQQAIHHGLEHVLDRELVAVFSDEVGFSFEEMLDLATVMPKPGTVIWRPEV